MRFLRFVLKLMYTYVLYLHVPITMYISLGPSIQDFSILLFSLLLFGAGVFLSTLAQTGSVSHLPFKYNNASFIPLFLPVGSTCYRSKSKWVCNQDGPPIAI